MLEHLLLQLPFILYLLYERKFYGAVVLFVGAIMLSFYKQQLELRQTIPTPFKRMPFEFIVGFRKTFILVLAMYPLVWQAIQVDNFNLALFCLIANFLIFTSYYFEPEKVFFVWMFNKDPNKFLLHKIGFGILSSIILSAPLCLILLLWDPSNWFLILGVEMIGLVIIVAIILAKYSAFPHQMNLPQVILFTLCVVFPLLLFFAIPVFYFQAKKRLRLIIR